MRKSKVNIEINKRIVVSPDKFHDGIVTAVGNGAHIMFKKEYIGKKVWIIIQDETTSGK